MCSRTSFSCLKRNDFVGDILTCFFVTQKPHMLTVQFALGSDFGAPNDLSQTSSIVKNDRRILIFGKTGDGKICRSNFEL
jgi:hypothetical protein